MSAPHASTVILLPSFNDWNSLALLLPELDRYLTVASRTASVLIVDDGSTEPLPPDWLAGREFESIALLEILKLRMNVGHQRAIALGLYHLHENERAATVVVMDADGEDRAQDVPTLLAEYDRRRGRDVVFAARAKRLESVAFRTFYRIYRFIHWLLTGMEVRVGNFSVVPREAIERLMASADLWNHFAAAVCRARIPRAEVPLPRGRRLAGTSKMNFVSLSLHGISSMSVFSDQVSTRMLTASAVLALIALLLAGSAVGVWLFTDQTVPGWATTTVGILIGLVMQAVTFATLFGFLITSRRSELGFLPLRDGPYFILGTSLLASRGLQKLGQALREESATPAPMEVRK